MTGQRNDDPDRRVRVGDISRATGLTVRTLHYYEEIGLVTPDRAASGHRLYDVTAVDRLYRVQLMRTLGMTLADIARTLGSAPGTRPPSPADASATSTSTWPAVIACGTDWLRRSPRSTPSTHRRPHRC